MEPRTIAVIGGDARQGWAADALEFLGHRVPRFGVPRRAEEEDGQSGKQPRNAASLGEAMAEADVVLCPVPFTRDGIWLSHTAEPPIPISGLLKGLRPGHRLIAGDFPEELRAHCEEKGIPLHALLEREDFATLNAIPTAEATIAQAIIKSSGNLQQSDCLVLGFGRCGRAIARKLKGLDANVTVALRRWPNACAALTAGFQAVDMEALPWLVPRPRYVFNTIPAPVLGEELLRLLPKEALLLDVASAPGGIDFEAARQMGLNAELLPSLPGKYAPRAAGEAIAQVTQIILQEEEEAKL